MSPVSFPKDSSRLTWRICGPKVGKFIHLPVYSFALTNDHDAHVKFVQRIRLPLPLGREVALVGALIAHGDGVQSEARPGLERRRKSPR